MHPKDRQTWEDFLNPDVMRPRLIAASIYIAGYESLKDSIIDHIRSFFTNRIDASGDKIDPKYQADVLSRNKSPLHASLDWLKSMDAIDNADIGAFDRVKTCRNILAHKLLSTLGTEGMPPDFGKCFGEMLTLLRKIEVWWIREIEVSTNPALDGQEVSDADIQPGRCIIMQLLCGIALSDPAESRAMFEDIRKGIDERTRPK